MHPKYSNLRSAHLVYSVLYQYDNNGFILTQLIIKDEYVSEDSDMFTVLTAC
jgi:hypothetical protein